MFADVSGFTALSERLAARGKVGAEQLTDILDAVFGRMLGLARARGGSLLKFGGDALLLLFTGDNHTGQAAAAAVEMRHALAEAARAPTVAGRVRLRMSIGIDAGRVDLFLVGKHWQELIVTGPTASGVAEMESLADAGQILLSPAAAANLPHGALGSQKGRGRLLRWRVPHMPVPADLLDPDPHADPRALLSPPLRELLVAGPVEAEHRTIAVAFLRFTQLDGVLSRSGPHAAAAALEVLVSAAQQAATENQVTFLATDLAEDGGKIILVAGFPAAGEDDAGRLLRAVKAVVDDAASRPGGLAVCAGANRGHVFAGAVGAADRATVTVMGDTVNVAARVMAKAHPGEVLATPALLDSAQTLFESQPIQPFRVKGKSRPLSAYRVQDATGTRPPRGLGALPLLGRSAEREALHEAIDSLADGRGGVVTITADAGLGKTRLLREAIAATRDAVVVDARAEPFGGASPYRPVRDPLRALWGLQPDEPSRMAESLVDRARAADPALLPWAPLLGEVLSIDVPDTAATRDLDRRYRPHRTADAVVGLLSAAVQQPLAVVVDDAHYVDDATSVLLARLAQETASHPWLLLCARRAEPTGFHTPHGLAISLTPLGDDETRALVAAGTEAAPLRPHDVDAIVGRVAGNPLFIEETLRNLRDHGDIGDLPSSLEGMIAAQIDALSPLARRIVRRASVLGRSFRISVLRDLFEGEPLHLDDATRHETAEIFQEDGPDRLRFRQAMVRDAAYDGLPYVLRQRLHLLAAESILRHTGGNTAAYADYLAMHYSLGGDAASTWHWARAAAEQARAAFANDDAAINYRRALSAARSVPGLTDADLVAVHEALGDVLLLSGEYEQALNAFRVGSRVGADPTTRSRLLLRCARAQERAQRFVGAYRDLTRAGHLLESDDDAEAQQLSATIAATRAHILTFQDRFIEARRQAGLAIAEATRAHSDRALAQALVAMDTCAASLGLSNRGEYLRRALPIYERLDDLEGQSTTTSNLGAVAYLDGDWDTAAELYRRAIVLAERIGDVSGVAVTQGNLCEILVNQGKYTEAEPVLRSALRVLRATGLEADAGFAEVLLGRAMAAQGRTEDAEAVLARVHEELLAAGQPDVSYLAAIAQAEIAISREQPQRALDLLAEAERHARESASLLIAVAARARVLALRDLGRTTEAMRWARIGISSAAEQGLVYERALLEAVVADLDPSLSKHDAAAIREGAAQSLDRLGVRQTPI